MGMFTDFIAARKSFQLTDRFKEQLDHYSDLTGDPAVPVAFAGGDEVQTAAVATGANDGTYTLTIQLRNQDPFTTAALNHDDDAATIEAAIDTAATSAGVTDWTNGDISVSGGPLDTSPVVLTYDGDSVSDVNHGLASVTSSLITVAVDEVQTITAATAADGGTYTLTIELDGEDPFTTAALNHDDNAATIEGAIDTAATSAGVTDWTNGDISVSGGPMNATDVVLTFDGTSVAGKDHTLTVCNSSMTTDPVDEVQTIAAAPSDDGTYTITIDLAAESPFTTAALNHDDAAATIEAAIDTAATSAGVTDWTNGDISVSGGPIDTNPVVLTFDGDSVDETDQELSSVTSSLTLSSDPVSDPSVAETTPGHALLNVSDPSVAETTPGSPEAAVAAPSVTETTVGGDSRPGWAILKELGIIADTAPPSQGEVLNVTAGPNHLMVQPWFVKAVATEIQYQDDGRGVYEGIIGPSGLDMNLANAPQS